MIQYIVYGFDRDFTAFCQVFTSEDRAYNFRDRKLAQRATVHITLAS